MLAFAIKYASSLGGRKRARLGARGRVLRWTGWVTRDAVTERGGRGVPGLANGRRGAGELENITQDSDEI